MIHFHGVQCVSCLPPQPSLSTPTKRFISCWLHDLLSQCGVCFIASSLLEFLQLTLLFERFIFLWLHDSLARYDVCFIGSSLTSSPHRLSTPIARRPLLSTVVSSTTTIARKMEEEAPTIPYRKAAILGFCFCSQDVRCGIHQVDLFVSSTTAQVPQYLVMNVRMGTSDPDAFSLGCVQ